MADITWIKLKTDMFENEKIRLIEALPEADTILIIWVKLLAYAGKANAAGYIMLTENVPLSTEALATLFGRPLNTVRLALETFKRYKMIEVSESDDGEIIKIKNWDVYQNIESMEKVREQNRLRKQKQRERQKMVQSPKNEALDTPSNQEEQDSHTMSRDRHATDKEREKEDKDKEKDKKTSRRANKFDDAQMALAELLLSLIREHNPDYKQPNLEKWANDIRLMMERDHRTKDQIDYLIRWCQQDAFWHTNILSPAKLREQFDRLVMICKEQAQKKKEAEEQAKNRSPNDFAAKKLERERMAKENVLRRYQQNGTSAGNGTGRSNRENVPVSSD